MKRLILVLLFAVFSIPRPSAAGVLTIDFDLGNTVIPGGFNAPDPNPIPVRSGVVTLSLTGVDSSGMMTGPMFGAMLTGFMLGVDIVQPSGNLALLDFSQVGVAPLTLSGGFLQLAPDGLVGNVRIAFQAPGATDPFLVNTIPFNSGGTSSFPLAGLLGGAARLQTTSDALFLRFGGDNVPFLIDGREIARRFVPEPEGPGLSALVLVALVAATWIRSGSRFRAS
jgi:hypothetical protein